MMIIHYVIAAALIYAGLHLLSFWARSRFTNARLRYDDWGEIYVLQRLDHPSIIKVGRTGRDCETRKREVSKRNCGGARLRRLYSVKVPFHSAVEPLVHKRIRKLRFWCESGEEWFKLRSPDDLSWVIGHVDAAARDIRKLARKRKRWSSIADEDSKRWRLTGNGPVVERLF